MPMRVGFALYRKDMLERELAGIEKLLPTLGVERVILVGDMVTGNITPESEIRLVVVQKTEYPFGRRADFFSYHLDSEVALDTLVYTPDEFDTLAQTLPALHQACQQGRVLYHA